MTDSRTYRGFSGALAVLVLLVQGVFPHAAEANFWDERRRAARRAGTSAGDEGGFPSAGLSSLSPDQQRLFAQLPKAGPAASFGAPVADAAGGLSVSPLPEATGAGDSLSWLSSLVLPHGSLREVRLSSREDAPFIVHVQDAHGLEEAQRNIAGLIQALQENRGVALVGVEGAEGAFSPVEPLRAIARPEAAREVAGAFLREGRIGGAEYAALTSPRAPTLWGVERMADHAANVRAVKESFRARPAAEAWRAALAARAEELKKSLYPPALAEFDRRSAAYRRHEESLGDHARALAAAIPSAMPPNLSLLVKALDAEDAIDFRRVEQERLRLVERLAKALPSRALDELVQRSLQHRLGQWSYGRYHAYLKSLCARHAVPLSDLPQLQAYVDYVLLAERIDRGALLEELESRERAVEAALADTPERRRLAAASRRLSLLDNLIRHRMSPRDWEAYQRKDDSLAFLRRDGDGPAPSLAPFEDFCRIALGRNEAFVDNLLGKMKAERAKAAVLVAGGFHSDDLAARLSAKGCSVAVVTPKITEVPKDSNYLDVFARDPLPLEKMFSGEIISLVDKLATSAPGPAVNQLAADQGAVEARLRGAEGASLASIEPAVDAALKDADARDVRAGEGFGAVDLVHGTGARTVVVDVGENAAAGAVAAGVRLKDAEALETPSGTRLLHVQAVSIPVFVGGVFKKLAKALGRPFRREPEAIGRPVREAGVGQHPLGERDFSEDEKKALVLEAEAMLIHQAARRVSGQTWSGMLGRAVAHPSNEAARVIAEERPWLMERIDEMVETLRREEVVIDGKTYRVRLINSEAPKSFVTGTGRSTSAFGFRDEQKGIITLYFHDLQGLVHEGLEHLILPLHRGERADREGRFHTDAVLAEAAVDGEVMTHKGRGVAVSRRILGELDSLAQDPERREAFIEGYADAKRDLRKKYAGDPEARAYGISFAGALHERAHAQASALDRSPDAFAFGRAARFMRQVLWQSFIEEAPSGAGLTARLALQVGAGFSIVWFISDFENLLSGIVPRTILFPFLLALYVLGPAYFVAQMVFSSMSFYRSRRPAPDELRALAAERAVLLAKNLGLDVPPHQVEAAARARIVTQKMDGGHVLRLPLGQDYMALDRSLVFNRSGAVDLDYDDLIPLLDHEMVHRFKSKGWIRNDIPVAEAYVELQKMADGVLDPYKTSRRSLVRRGMNLVDKVAEGRARNIEAERIARRSASASWLRELYRIAEAPYTYNLGVLQAGMIVRSVGLELERSDDGAVPLPETIQRMRMERLTELAQSKGGSAFDAYVPFLSQLRYLWNRNKRPAAAPTGDAVPPVDEGKPSLKDYLRGGEGFPAELLRKIERLRENRLVDKDESGQIWASDLRERGALQAPAVGPSGASNAFSGVGLHRGYVFRENQEKDRSHSFPLGRSPSGVEEIGVVVATGESVDAGSQAVLATAGLSSCTGFSMRYLKADGQPGLLTSHFEAGHPSGAYELLKAEIAEKVAEGASGFQLYVSADPGSMVGSADAAEATGMNRFIPIANTRIYFPESFFKFPRTAEELLARLSADLGRSDLDVRMSVSPLQESEGRQPFLRTMYNTSEGVVIVYPREANYGRNVPASEFHPWPATGGKVHPFSLWEGLRTLLGVRRGGVLDGALTGGLMPLAETLLLRALDQGGLFLQWSADLGLSGPAGPLVAAGVFFALAHLLLVTLPQVVFIGRVNAGRARQGLAPLTRGGILKSLPLQAARWFAGGAVFTLLLRAPGVSFLGDWTGPLLSFLTHAFLNIRQVRGRPGASARPSSPSDALVALALDEYQKGGLEKLSQSLAARGLTVEEVRRALAEAGREFLAGKLKGADFETLKKGDEVVDGSVMDVYAAKTLPGVIVKVAKPGSGIIPGSKATADEIFEKKVLPGFRLVKDSLGRFFALTILEDVELSVQGRPVRHKHVIVQEKVVIAADVLGAYERDAEAAARNGDKKAEARARAAIRALQDQFIALSHDIWRRDLSDNDYSNWRNNYGLTPDGRLVAIDVDKFSTKPALLNDKTMALGFGFEEESDKWMNHSFTHEERERILAEKGPIPVERVPDLFAMEMRGLQEARLRGLLEGKTGSEERERPGFEKAVLTTAATYAAGRASPGFRWFVERVLGRPGLTPQGDAEAYDRLIEVWYAPQYEAARFTRLALSLLGGLFVPWRKFAGFRRAWAEWIRDHGSLSPPRLRLTRIGSGVVVGATLAGFLAGAVAAGFFFAPLLVNDLASVKVFAGGLAAAAGFLSAGLSNRLFHQGWNVFFKKAPLTTGWSGDSESDGRVAPRRWFGRLRRSVQRKPVKKRQAPAPADQGDVFPEDAGMLLRVLDHVGEAHIGTIHAVLRRLSPSYAAQTGVAMDPAVLRAQWTRAAMTGAAEIAALPALKGWDQVGEFTLVRGLSAGGFGVVHLAQGKDGSPAVVKEPIYDELDERISSQALSAAARAFKDRGRPIRLFKLIQLIGRQIIERERLKDLNQAYDAAGERPPVRPVPPVVDDPRAPAEHIVMGLVPGVTGVVKRRGGLDKGDRLGVLSVEEAVALARALEFVHAQGVIHNDVKPANLIVSYDAALKPHGVVLDFGAAVDGESVGRRNGLPDPGDRAFTHAYVAPERVSRNDDAPLHGYAADVFSFAVTLRELLPPGITRELPELDDLLAEAESSDPADRPSDMGEMRRRLEDVLLGMSPAQRVKEMRWIALRGALLVEKAGDVKDLEDQALSLAPRLAGRADELLAELRAVWSGRREPAAAADAVRAMFSGDSPDHELGRRFAVVLERISSQRLSPAQPAPPAAAEAPIEVPASLPSISAAPSGQALIFHRFYLGGNRKDLRYWLGHPSIGPLWEWVFRAAPVAVYLGGLGAGWTDAAVLVTSALFGAAHFAVDRRLGLKDVVLLSFAGFFLSGAALSAAALSGGPAAAVVFALAADVGAHRVLNVFLGRRAPRAAALPAPAEPLSMEEEARKFLFVMGAAMEDPEAGVLHAKRLWDPSARGIPVASFMLHEAAVQRYLKLRRTDMKAFKELRSRLLHRLREEGVMDEAFHERLLGMFHWLRSPEGVSFLHHQARLPEPELSAEDRSLLDRYADLIDLAPLQNDGGRDMTSLLSRQVPLEQVVELDNVVARILERAAESDLMNIYVDVPILRDRRKAIENILAHKRGKNGPKWLGAFLPMASLPTADLTAASAESPSLGRMLGYLFSLALVGAVVYFGDLLTGMKRRPARRAGADASGISLSDEPELSESFDRLVRQHLAVNDFARRLERLTISHGRLSDFPAGEVERLLSSVEFRQWDRRDLSYFLGFVTEQIAGIRPEVVGFNEKAQANIVLLFALGAAGVPWKRFAGHDPLLVRLFVDTVQFLVKEAPLRLEQGLPLSVDKNLSFFPLPPSEGPAFYRGLEETLRALHQPRVYFHEWAAQKSRPFPSRVQVLEEFKALLPDDFLERPGGVVAPVPPASRRKAGQLSGIPEVALPLLPGEEEGKIRTLRLKNGQQVFVKRVNPLRSLYPEEEIDIARRVDAALQAEDPHYHAQKFIGVAYDQGLYYLISLAVPHARVLAEEPESPDAGRIQRILEREGVADPRSQARLDDVLVTELPGGEREYTVIDFESLPYRANDNDLSGDPDPAQAGKPLSLLGRSPWKSLGVSPVLETELLRSALFPFLQSLGAPLWAAVPAAAVLMALAHAARYWKEGVTFRDTVRWTAGFAAFGALLVFPYGELAPYVGGPAGPWLRANAESVGWALSWGAHLLGNVFLLGRGGKPFSLLKDLVSKRFDGEARFAGLTPQERQELLSFESAGTARHGRVEDGSRAWTVVVARRGDSAPRERSFSDNRQALRWARWAAMGLDLPAEFADAPWRGALLKGENSRISIPLEDGWAVSLRVGKTVVLAQRRGNGLNLSFPENPGEKDRATGPSVILGRGEGLPLTDPEISRRHVALSLSGGQLTVEDLASRNGTLTAYLHSAPDQPLMEFFERTRRIVPSGDGRFWVEDPTQDPRLGMPIHADAGAALRAAVLLYARTRSPFTAINLASSQRPTPRERSAEKTSDPAGLWKAYEDDLRRAGVSDGPGTTPDFSRASLEGLIALSGRRASLVGDLNAVAGVGRSSDASSYLKEALEHGRLIAQAARGKALDDAQRREAAVYLATPGLVRTFEGVRRVDGGWDVDSPEGAEAVLWTEASTDGQLLLSARPQYRRAVAKVLERFASLGLHGAGPQTASSFLSGAGPLHLPNGRRLRDVTARDVSAALRTQEVPASLAEVADWDGLTSFLLARMETKEVLEVLKQIRSVRQGAAASLVPSGAGTPWEGLREKVSSLKAAELETPRRRSGRIGPWGMASLVLLSLVGLVGTTQARSLLPVAEGAFWLSPLLILFFLPLASIFSSFKGHAPSNPTLLESVPGLEEGLVEKDRALFREIIRGDRAAQERLIKLFPGKVSRPEDEEVFGLLGAVAQFLRAEGRTMYLRLEAPVTLRVDGVDKTVSVLRFKGVRPVMDGFSRVAAYATGRGRAHRQIIEERPLRGLVLRTQDEEPVGPRGTMLLKRAYTEHRAASRLSAQGVSVDAPLAVGSYGFDFGGSPVGFAVFGLEEDDRRLVTHSRVKRTFGVNKMNQRDSVRFEDLDESLPAQLFEDLGRSVRRMHRGGLIHRYIHSGNVGLRKRADAKWVTVLRDLDTVEPVPSGASPAIVAAHRFLDVSRPLYDLLSSLVESENPPAHAGDPRIRAFLTGYFSELDPAGADFAALDKECQNVAFAEAVMRADTHQDGGGEVALAKAFPRLWERLLASVAADDGGPGQGPSGPGSPSRRPEGDGPDAPSSIEKERLLREISPAARPLVEILLDSRPVYFEAPNRYQAPLNKAAAVRAVKEALEKPSAAAPFELKAALKPLAAVTAAAVPGDGVLFINADGFAGRAAGEPEWDALLSLLSGVARLSAEARPYRVVVTDTDGRSAAALRSHRLATPLADAGLLSTAPAKPVGAGAVDVAGTLESVEAGLSARSVLPVARDEASLFLEGLKKLLPPLSLKRLAQDVAREVEELLLLAIQA